MKYNISRAGLCARIVILVSLAHSAFGAVDNNPKNAGETQGREAGGGPTDAITSNPALLGSQRTPQKTLQVFPFSRYGLSYWSNTLDVPFGLNYFDLALQEQNNTFNRLIRESMKIEGLSDTAALQRVTSKFPHGASLYGGAKGTFLSWTAGRFAIDVTSEAHGDITLPEVALAAIADDSSQFNLDSFDFSTFRQRTIAATNVSFALGLPLPTTGINKYIRLPKTAIGIRAAYVLGHSYLKTDADTGAGNELWHARYQASGMGLSASNTSSPVNGQGYNIDLGLLLYGEHAGLSLQVKNIGSIYWMNDLAEGTYTISGSDLRTDKYFPKASRDTLALPRSIVSHQPTMFLAGYSYMWNAPAHASETIKNLAYGLYGAATYRYVFYEYPGISIGSVATLGLSTLMFSGHMPVRVGWSFGGKEKQTSTVGLGFDFSSNSADISFTAIGSSAWNPKKGFNIAAEYGWSWGFDRDWDNDRVIDKNDKCPDVPEDRDKFEDSDGCPDLDNDNDGILDTKDKCPNVAEDMDGFKDADGCPDYDNDKDRIPDSLDKCLNIAEDKDGFEDADGCPDFDNDADGLPDSVDKCISIAENMNDFEDSDGCPDEKPMAPPVREDVKPPVETAPDIPLPAFEKPDTMLAEKVVDTKSPYTESCLVEFAIQSTQLTDSAKAVLDELAKNLRDALPCHLAIHGYSDSLGTSVFNMRISRYRAMIVKDYLVSLGIPEITLEIFAHGKNDPIASNATPEGRQMNRRATVVVKESK